MSNTTQKRLYTRNERSSIVGQALKSIVDFYKNPLINAVMVLREEGRSYSFISKKVFNGEISAKAVSQNYIKRGGK